VSTSKLRHSRVNASTIASTRSRGLFPMRRKRSREPILDLLGVKAAATRPVG
jgi:hypothetical protein